MVYVPWKLETLKFLEGHRIKYVRHYAGEWANRNEPVAG